MSSLEALDNEQLESNVSSDSPLNTSSLNNRSLNTNTLNSNSLNNSMLENDLLENDLLENEMDELDLLGEDLELDTSLSSTDDALANMAINPTNRNANFDLIKDIPVEITVEVSRKSLPLKELMNFESGNIIMLDKKEGEPVDIKINGVLFGTGNIIAQDGKYGVRILSMVKHDKPS